MVDVPAVLTRPEQRAAYLVENYWKNLDYADTSLISMPEVIEQAFVDFLQVLPYATTESVRHGIDRNLSDAQQGSEQMLAYMRNLYERYLYDPNSPMRNEELYIIYLQSVIDNSGIEDVEKIRPRHQLEVAMKNRVGALANNFKFTDSEGRNRELHKSTVGKYTILMFNNPGCPACAEIKSEIDTSQLIKKLGVSIVAIYVDDDLDAWRASQSQIPRHWISGYTKGRTQDMSSLYDLRAIPSLYLLGADKRVILKDQPFSIIENYLRENS